MGFLILDKNLKFCYTYDVIDRTSAQALPRYEAIYQYGLVRGAITNAVTLNRYAYANANPVTNIDPLGLDPDLRATVCQKDGISDYNYIFRSDPYWEDLLTNNDAIYCQRNIVAR